MMRTSRLVLKCAEVSVIITGQTKDLEYTYLDFCVRFTVVVRVDRNEFILGLLFELALSNGSHSKHMFVIDAVSLSLLMTDAIHTPIISVRLKGVMIPLSGSDSDSVLIRFSTTLYSGDPVSNTSKSFVRY